MEERQSAPTSSLLGNPSTIRIRGTTSEMNSSAPEFNEEQYVYRFQEKRFDGEEVTGQDLVFVVGLQVTPTW